MILVDTSVWVDHFRRVEPILAALLEGGEVSSHPFIVGELACGNLKNHGEILSLMRALPTVAAAEHSEVLHMVESNRLFGSGIGWVDAHLVASARLASILLWTRDKNLSRVARGLGILFDP